MIITEKVRTQLAGDFPKVCLCRKGLRSECLNVSDSVPHLLCSFFICARMAIRMLRHRWLLSVTLIEADPFSCLLSLYEDFES